MTLTVDTVYRDFVIDGSPSTGVWWPDKADIRALLNGLAVASGSAGAGLSGAQASFTASATVSTALAGYTLLIGGSASGTLTWGAASGYTAGQVNFVVNTSTRRWILAPSGIAQRYLFPGQAAFVINCGGSWYMTPFQRWATPSPGAILYVDHALGNDGNDGLATGSGNAFATIQNAITVCERQIDAIGFGTLIQVADGTFTDADNTVHTHRIVGNHVIGLQGNLTTPGNCVWQVKAGLVGLTVRDYSAMIVSGFHMVGLGSGATALSASQTGICDWGSMEFDSFPGGFHIASVNGGSMGHSIGATSKIMGGAAYHLFAGGGKIIATGCTFNTPNNITMSQQFALSSDNGTITTAGVTLTGTGTVTGQKYACDMNGTIESGGVVFPGTVAGSTSRGGEYA